MALITKQFLQDIGIELDEQTYAHFSEHFDATLESRVIESILDELDENQLQELATLKGDEEKLGPWLEANVPDLKDIIQTEVDILLGELAENADHI